MALFGRKKPTLTLAAEPDRVLPGQPVQLRVAVDGEMDKVRGVHAGLRATNRYVYEYRDTDGDRHTRHASETVHEESVPLAQGQLPAGSHAVALTVPPSGPPSAPGTVEWEAWAKVDMPGRDVNQEVPLAVLAPAQLRPQDAQSPAVTDDDCDVRLDGLASRYVRPGDWLQGTLVVTPRDDVKATEVRVELLALKTSHSSRGREVEKAAEVKAPVAGGGDLPAGQTLSWPFAIQVPPDAVPSLQTTLTTIQWKLAGVVARRMRTDHSGHVDLTVYNV